MSFCRRWRSGPSIRAERLTAARRDYFQGQPMGQQQPSSLERLWAAMAAAGTATATRNSTRTSQVFDIVRLLLTAFRGGSPGIGGRRGSVTVFFASGYVGTPSMAYTTTA